MADQPAPNLPPTHDKHPANPRALRENRIDHALIQRKVGHLIRGIEVESGQTVLKIEPKNIRTVLETLHGDPELSFKMLTDITAVDNMRREDFEPARRFTMVYIVYSIEYAKRIRIETDLPEHDPKIASTVGIYKGGPWVEREVYDMFGVIFANHPDLRRVLMPDYYEHFPLRKDYPLTGRGERDNFVRAEEVE